MKFFRSWITVIAKFFGLHPRPSAARHSIQATETLIVEKSAVAIVGGGRRPARLRGKHVRMNCQWQVIEHSPISLVLSRSGEVPSDVDNVLATTTARIKKIGAGRRPENLVGLTVRVMTTFTVREDHGDRIVLSPVAA